MAPGRAEGARRAGLLRPALLVLLAYLFLPFWTQRALLLGSDASAGGASRSDTIVVTKAGWGMLAVPRDTLVITQFVSVARDSPATPYPRPRTPKETRNFLRSIGTGMCPLRQAPSSPGSVVAAHP